MAKNVVLFGVLLFLAACASSPPEDAQQTAAITSYIRSGSQGLELKFSSDLPPPVLYDTADLVSLLELRNVGAIDLDENSCVVQFSGFDPNIIRGINGRQLCGMLPGKNVYNQEGGFTTLEFKSSSMNLPRDVDRYQPTLVATTCYEYTTIASPQVCVDPQFYELTQQQKACRVRDIGVGGGQGAPVAVTFVNVDMIGSKAVFSLDIANVGSGRVVSPRASLTRCPIGLKYDEFDEVRYQVELSGGRLIQCTPRDALARLSNNKGKIVCTFEMGNTQAYETPLRVELSYNYMQSVQRPVQIVRTPG